MAWEVREYTRARFGDRIAVGPADDIEDRSDSRYGPN